MLEEKDTEEIRTIYIFYGPYPNFLTINLPTQIINCNRKGGAVLLHNLTDVQAELINTDSQALRGKSSRWQKKKEEGGERQKERGASEKGAIC